MKTRIILILFFSFLFVNCGFKVADKNFNFKISSVDTSGDRKINYVIKNKILLNSNTTGQKLINLDINTKKIKSINEKNISNQITKYELKIETKVKYLILENGKSDEFIVTLKGFYDVNSRYSETLNNEKNLINLLTNNLSEEILERLVKKINDI